MTRHTSFGMVSAWSDEIKGASAIEAWRNGEAATADASKSDAYIMTPWEVMVSSPLMDTGPFVS